MTYGFYCCELSNPGKQKFEYGKLYKSLSPNIDHYLRRSSRSFLMLRITEAKLVVRLVSVCGDGGCALPDLSAVAHVSVRGWTCSVLSGSQQVAGQAQPLLASWGFGGPVSKPLWPNQVGKCWRAKWRSECNWGRVQPVRCRV